MKLRHRGFTYSELLVVIAILAIVAAVTFPVMRAAKEFGKRTACVSQFHQTQLATDMYLADYDDRFMLVNYRVREPKDAAHDRTWVQLLLPYLSTLDLFECPADMRHAVRQDAVIDVDLVPGDTSDRYYQLSLLSNIGYNYLYLSPITRTAGRWSIEPRSYSQISDPSSMLLFVDTIASRRLSRRTSGGGSYIVAPPCRFGSDRSDSFMLPSGSEAFAPTRGWKPNRGADLDRYGRAWPWHNGRSTVTFVGGNTKAVTMQQLTAGCRVRENWGGTIEDTGSYFWDFH